MKDFSPTSCLHLKAICFRAAESCLSEENIILIFSEKKRVYGLPAIMSMSAMISGPTSSSFILWQRRFIIPGMSYLSASQATISTLRSAPVKSPV